MELTDKRQITMKKILVVDDKKNVRISLSIGLRRKGYHVDVASNAVEALTKMRRTIYDYMLTDVRMPTTNGIELAHQVSKFYPHVRIILMSAYDFKDYEKKYKDLSNYPKLSKPFEIMDILTLLNKVDRSPNVCIEKL